MEPLVLVVAGGLQLVVQILKLVLLAVLRFLRQPQFFAHRLFLLHQSAKSKPGATVQPTKAKNEEPAGSDANQAPAGTTN